MIVTKVILIIGYIAQLIVRPGTMKPRYKNRDVRSAFVTTGDVRSATSPVTGMTVVVY